LIFSGSAHAQLRSLALLARQVIEPEELHGRLASFEKWAPMLNAAARPDQPCICQTESRPAGCQAAAPDQ
jgi:hypothetical protein